MQLIPTKEYFRYNFSCDEFDQFYTKVKQIGFSLMCAVLVTYSGYYLEMQKREEFARKWSLLLRQRENELHMREMEDALAAKHLTPEQFKLLGSVMSSDSSDSGNAAEDFDQLAALRVEPSSVVIKKLNIGRGASGDVHLAEWNSAKIAVKQLTMVTEDTLKVFKHEILLMSQLRHPNIISLLGALWSQEIVGLMLEFAEGGSLSEALENKTVSESWTWANKFNSLTMDIARGLLFLHKSNYHDPVTNVKESLIHRDLKTGNILLNGDFSTAKVADFGSSRGVVATSADVTMTMAGTPIYMAPEIVRGEHYNKTADIYSFGVLMFALTCPKGDAFQLFRKCVGVERSKSGVKDAEENTTQAGSMNIMQAVAELNLRPDLSQEERIPPSVRHVISKCWARNPRERPTLEVVMSSLTENRSKIRRDGRQAEERREKNAKELVKNARSDVHIFKAPVLLVSASHFLKMDELLSYETLQEGEESASVLKSFPDIGSCEEFITKNFTVFISHQWLSWEKPDPEGVQLLTMKNAVKQLAAMNKASINNVYVWVDFCSIPQNDAETQLLAVHSLPAVSSTLQVSSRSLNRLCSEPFVVAIQSITHRLRSRSRL